MHLAVVLACSASWMSSASAGPAVIVASRVEALAAPSRDAGVVSELGHGAPVCVLDETNYPGVLLPGPGWLAIRLPGGVGYVPVEAVDVAVPAPEALDCGASPGAPEAPAQTQTQTQAQDPAPAPPPRAARLAVVPPPPPPDRAPAVPIDRSGLIAGRLLPLHPMRFLIGMGTGAAWLDKQSAAAQHIDSSGITFNGTLGLTLFDVVMVSGSFAAAFPSDGASFSEEVVPEMGGGDPQTAGSSLAVVSSSIAVGLRTPFWALGQSQNGWVAGALFAQYGSAGIHGSRSISNCADCRSNEFSLPGGAFVRVGVDLLVPSRRPTVSYGVTASYERYGAGAGFSDEFRIGFSCWLM
jgi:hypothetical protein